MLLHTLHLGGKTTVTKQVCRGKTRGESPFVLKGDDRTMVKCMHSKKVAPTEVNSFQKRINQWSKRINHLISGWPAASECHKEEGEDWSWLVFLLCCRYAVMLLSIVLPYLQPPETPPPPPFTWKFTAFRTSCRLSKWWISQGLSHQSLVCEDEARLLTALQISPDNNWGPIRGAGMSIGPFLFAKEAVPV